MPKVYATLDSFASGKAKMDLIPSFIGFIGMRSEG